MHDLSGKVVFVTGASKGIGAAIARAAGRAGASVIAHYGSDEEGARKAVEELPRDRQHLVQADLGDLQAVEQLWEESLAWRRGIDVFVNNAAVMLWDGGLDQPLGTWDRVWDETLRVNLLAPARLMRQAVKHFLARGGGSIITISSWAAQRGVTNPDTIAYGASKAAIRAATQTIARAYAARGLLAYVIAPGVVRTRLSQQFAQTQGGEAVISAGLASGRWVEPEEIAETVLFLASGVAPQLSGATLDMNGASYIR
jgi:NAD(P)-dependent dehydrogenase (short-subunit alcohol dehydrogenase family)